MLWIDASCKGGSARDHAAGTPTIEQLLAEMRRLRIDRALVHSAWSDRIAADAANDQLFEDLAPHENLLPVPELLPEGGERFLDRPGDAVRDLVRRGAAAGFALCKKDKYLLTAWCAGEMLEAMQALRLPLMVKLEDIEPDHLHALLRDFPDLPVLLQEVPRIGYHRIVYPLMARFSSLYLVCDAPHSVHLGIEYLVNRFGPDRLVWGSRFPLSEGGASISGLTYADISDDARAAVAGGTMQKLLQEVNRA